MKSTPWNVHSADQTTYAVGHPPSEVRIVHPPHPLIGKTLPVIRHFRQGSETYWIVRLADGSNTSLPSAWTDHSRSPSPPPLRLGGKYSVNP